VSRFEDTDNPKELKTGELKWLDRAAYKAFGDLQADLNEAERGMLVDQLAVSFERYERLVLNLYSVREALYLHYNQLVKSHATTSQLSRRFNMSLRGHNRQLRDMIDSAFEFANMMERQNDPDKAAFWLLQAEISHKVLFSPGMSNLIRKSRAHAAARELVRIRQFQQALFRSVIMLAVSVARAHNLRLKGSTVEWTDLAQEAIIGALQAVEAYHPIDSGQTFTSFVRTWVSGIVSKRVNETTRTVPIPRSMIDRYDYVHKAIQVLGLVVSDLRGGVRQEGRLIEGKVDWETLCRIAYCATLLQAKPKKEEGEDEEKIIRPFSPEEVLDLLMNTQDTVSMELEVESDGMAVNGQEHVTFGETLPDDALNAEQRFDGSRVGMRLMAIVRRHTTWEEYVIMSLRYGQGVVLGCGRVSDLYVARTGKPMNKGKVTSVYKTVLERLRRVAASDPNLKRQFEEIEATVPFMDPD